MFPEISYLRAVAGAWRRRVVHDPDAGASVLEWVVITAIVVGAAVTAGAVFLARVRSETDKFRRR